MNNNSTAQLSRELPLPGTVSAARATEYAGYTGYAAGPYRDYNGDAGPGGLVECWNILRRRKGSLILLAFLGVLAGIAATLPQTPVYQARASLEIQSINQDFMNMRKVTPVSDGSTDYWSSDLQTHMKLLQSDSLVDRVITKLTRNGATAVSPDTNLLSGWRRALDLPEPKPTDVIDRAIRLAHDTLKLRAVGQTRVVEIVCDSTDRRLAANFINTLANEYIEQSMEARWQMNQRTAEWFSRQLDDMRIKLERSEDQLQKYARRTGLLFTGDKVKQNVSEEKLRQLQEELSRAGADRIAKQSRYEMAQNGAPETLVDILNDPSLRDYQAKLTDLRRTEADLAATYRPEYSKVQKVRAQIFTLEIALAHERDAVLNRIRNEYQAAERREKLLATDYAAHVKLVTAESEKSIQYNILQRETESTRQLYESMLQHVKESSIASAMHASNVRVVYAAKVPSAPYKPNLYMNGLGGLMGGLFLGVVFVMMRERADRSGACATLASWRRGTLFVPWIVPTPAPCS